MDDDGFKAAIRDQLEGVGTDELDDDIIGTVDAEPSADDVNSRIERALFPDDEPSDDDRLNPIPDVAEALDEHNEVVGRYGREVEQAGQALNQQWEALKQQHQSVNWQALNQQNPAQAQLLAQQFQHADMQLRAKAEQLRTVSERVRGAEATIQHAEAVHRMLDLIPAWKTERVRKKEAKELTDWLVEQGHSREAVMAERNPVSIHTAYKAWKADATGKAQRLSKLKTGVRGDRVSDLRARLKKSGSTSDAQALLVAKGVV